MEESEQGPSSSSGLGLRLRPKRKVSTSTDEKNSISISADGAAIRRSKSNKRICRNNANAASSEAPPKSLDEICAGTFILENVMSFLDTPTLKTCRTVNKNWEESARKVLMKRSFLNIVKWKGSSSEDSRLQQYSSWIVDYGKAEKENSIDVVSDHLRKWGESVKSLYITELPIDLRWNVWIRNVLTTWCPNVVAICLKFNKFTMALMNWEPSALLLGEWNAFRQSLESVESQEEFRLKLQTSRARRNIHKFQPISTLPNIQRIRLESCDGMACPFAFNVIQSCVNLKHLYINLEILDKKMLIGREFEILKYLAVRPEITKKLEVFEWTVVNVGYGFERNLYLESHRQLVRFVTANDDIPPMQFGARLKSLHWDVLHVDRDGGRLLPGILEKVAGNLRKLCSRKAVLNARDIFEPIRGNPFRAYYYYPPKILSVHFPMMAKLSVIEIGQKTCFAISLNDLVDAAPNLRNLKITDTDPSLVFSSGRNTYNIWTGSGSTVLVPNQHNTLKCLKAGYSFISSEVVRKTLWKFPNLEELWIDGDFCKGGMGQLEEVTCNNLDGLKSLKRLYFTSFGSANVGRMLDHLCKLPWKLESLELYKLISDVSRFDYREYFERKEELHKKILASSMGSTCKRLELWSDGRVACELNVGDRMEWKSVQQQAQKEFFTFIQKNKIPIEMFQIPV
jgi:hypothetical protein